MIEIRFGWRLSDNGILTSKVIGIGYHQGKTHFGQSDLITVTSEEVYADSGEVLWATMLFTSGRWYRQVRWFFKKIIRRSKSYVNKFLDLQLSDDMCKGIIIGSSIIIGVVMIVIIVLKFID